jgi:hypothetical protein
MIMIQTTEPGPEIAAALGAGFIESVLIIVTKRSTDSSGSCKK